MTFSQIILEHLGAIFNNYNVKVIEQRCDFVEVQSETCKIIIAHNHLENSNIVWLGVIDREDLVEIDNELLELYFHSKLKLSQVTVEHFVKNLHHFFQSEGTSIFASATQVNKLVDFDLKRSESYTQNIIHRQVMESADIAWENKDYNCFINIMDDIDYNILASSYKLKYKIAQNRK
jgi:hypothetical protein